MSANTATGTTGTAERGQPGSGLPHPSPVATRHAGSPPAAPPPAIPYVGRFAPSPTGDLHIGSLLAAVGSYLDARHHGGQWLVRIEDLDTPRIIPGCADRMLRMLEGFALHWDGPVLYQSSRQELYAAALASLTRMGHTFECSCSRRELAGQEEAGYPGTCRGGPTRRHAPTATRFHMPDGFVVLFDDRVQGECRFSGAAAGDFVVRRKDGIVSYQLAVVVDDDAQHVTNVVRGVDLLASAPWQIALHTALALPTPRYAHLPVVVEQNMEKLGKSRHSVAVDSSVAGALLVRVLRMLGQQVPAELESYAPQQILALAARNWNIAALQRIRSIPATDTAIAK